jgi:thiamine pyrophosphate-dependent acetolactate synthase large subunit-like protein
MEAARAINYHRKDALVVATSAALRDWCQVSQRRDLDVDLQDCMDRAPAVGLGLSLAQPGSKVLVLDCDSTLRTDLGGLATVGESQPENLVHVVFDDASHRSTGGLPIKALDHLDLPAMARSAGYAKTYQFDELEELVLGLEEALAQPGPVFVLVKVVRDEELPPMPSRSMAEGWAAVRRTISSGAKSGASTPRSA